jgi:pantoate--beta-alanine ligase
MQICRTIQEVRIVVAELNQRGDVGLVTTMGALHRGHVSLAETACNENVSVVATIFVNPTQFGNPEDLENYPKTEAEDLQKLEAAGVAAVFIPTADEMYPANDETIVETTNLANIMHGVVRPGHFRGVATVVSKLFNIVQADRAYFGKKDYQQLAVIRRMVLDLHMPIEIVGVDTVRDDDGVALSSRNVRLTPEERAAAPVLNNALDAAKALLISGESVETAIRVIKEMVDQAPIANLQAVGVVDAMTFAPASGKLDGTIGIMISALFGDVLLIDQKEVTR